MAEIWNLEALCRCCHADGIFKSLNEQYMADNSVENYHNLLIETLGVTIKPPPANASFSICDTCISQLLGACAFKRMVLDCETKFEEYCKNELLSNVKMEPEYLYDDLSDGDAYQDMGTDDPIPAKKNGDAYQDMETDDPRPPKKKGRCSVAVAPAPADQQFDSKTPNDTDADPHNATRGFFYSHVGWLLVKKHPEVLKRSRTIDMSDIYNNPVLRFQKKYGAQVLLSFAYILPSLIPMLWGQTFSDAWHINTLRIILDLHASCLVNSAAHAFGNKPYDKNIAATQISTLSFVTLGECFHNYHHVFPWDYRTAELGNNRLNLTTLFIDFFAWIGWAYDLKTVSDEMIESRAKRTGDGTNLWGWGDKDLVKGGEKVEEIFYGWGDKDMKDTSGVKVLYTHG